MNEQIRYEYFRRTAETGAPWVVDDKTASDLEIERIFAFIDSARTSPGSAVLYSWLRTQCPSRNSLNERMRLIRSWNGYAQTPKIRRILSRCGFQNHGSVVTEIWDPARNPSTRFRFAVFGWIALSAAAYLSPVFFGLSWILFCALPAAAVNILIHLRWHPRIFHYAETIFYIARLLRSCRRLVGHLPSELSSERDELRALIGRTRKLERSARMFFDPGRIAVDLFDSLAQYLRVFLLAELSAFLSAYRRINDLRPELERVFALLGSIDASLAVSDLLFREEGICEPVVSGGVKGIEFHDLVHPLVPDCVANSASFERGVILTGANMAGKSTFLRTLGVNQILATTLGFAFASEFRSSFMFVASSLQTVDSLERETSRYFEEARRLHELWRMGKENASPRLLLVDEVLSGTNSADRNLAVTAILSDLAGASSLLIVTTHELPIAAALHGRYDNYHFTETVRDGELSFDYRLKEGIVERSNALRLLRHVGFPVEIIPVSGDGE